MAARFRSLILCYHAASPSWKHELSIDPLIIERQIGSLVSRGFRPAPIEQCLEGAARLLHVTFDDAYRSVRNVLPALERLGARATVFACADFADDGRPLDVPELAQQAARHPDELATMAWDDLRELSERGVTVGSHTLSHPHLPELSDDELRRELAESRERIADELRHPCELMAYPYGEVDKRIKEAARATGYRAAFSLAARAENTDRFGLPRTDVYRKDTQLRFRLKTSPLRALAARRRSLGPLARAPATGLVV